MTFMEELSLVISQPDEGKFLQKIGWNKEQIMNAVMEITKQYTGLTYTEEQMQDAKKDRATLNAMRKDISDRRIQVKKALMAPYEAFEAEVKEVVAMIDEPIAMIASGVTAPELAKALILYPDEPGKDYGGDYHWMNNAGERLPFAGGGWDAGARAGVFYLNLSNARSHSNGSIGFRSAYVEL